jgi:uncharacterized membrane protein YdjX (TVP38/TMEM64 family)
LSTQRPPSTFPTVRTLRIAAVAAVAALALIAWRSGLLARFGDPAQLQRTLLDAGPYGYLAFVTAYATLQPFGVPGTVFIMVAPLVWPWPIAFALSMVGTMAASVVGFSFARFVARDWLSRRIPARFKRWEARLEARGFETVFLLRFIFWMPPLLHAFFGVSRVRFWTHFWASLLGYVIPLLAVSYFGERLFAILRGLSPASWALMVGAWIAIVALVVLVRRRRGLATEEA